MKLENENLILETRTRAGEMTSLFDKSKNRELLYQGNQGWSGRNPTLFPMVGSTWNNGSYTLDGKEYAMKNHGLIRYADLEGSTDGSKIVYTMDSSEETKAQYPFDFHYEMSYRLEGKKVIIEYAITNTGDQDMPFSFGLHPAFRTSLTPEEKFEDFSLEMFPKAEAEQIVFFDDFSPVERPTVMLDKWQLSREDLKKYATLVFNNIKASKAVLSWKDEPRLAMEFEGYPFLALWSHPTESDFVCIEPWFGHADYEKLEIPFDQREGTQILKPSETFKASYSVEAL